MAPKKSRTEIPVSNADHYNFHTTNELKKLIEARNLHPRPKPQSKADHIRILVHSDESHVVGPSFNFMGLPAELRNTIYEDVIDHEKGMKKWKKAFLFVSKAVSAEAKDIYWHNLAEERASRERIKYGMFRSVLT